MLHQWIWVVSSSLWNHCPTSNSHRRQGNVLYFADADPEFVAIHICLFPNFTLVESRVWSLPQAFHRPTWQDGRSILLITQMFPLQDILGVLTEQVPGYRSDINHPIKETNRMVKLSVYKEGSLLHHPTGIPQQILGHYSAKKQAVPDVTSWIRTGGFRVMKITDIRMDQWKHLGTLDTQAENSFTSAHHTILSCEETSHLARANEAY